ncbi:uroporphyrinogen-III C-methyltransferase [Granulicella pectinivorans]|jgi:uroporphyrin-III C-methyltransferase|uniref:uroporphyrinogen-III C-methyltransferase n=1 Tax=Granulicella pectinivorans TaxID=474950 RepID=A0A1I6MY82_9BACT|nr:uroporphyrinogen-III C-methyltransferase [Granulicella pectinivorans]SFS20634.1 uroporphyrinogen-III C-methyltransferase [Granulicella pectinivorans]
MTNPAAQSGTVYLAGAGPGDPALLTLRVLKLLETATTILHDDLVSPEILALANPSAELVSVGKRCGQPRVTQPEIHAMMIAAARDSQSVLRLKSGDPLIFGRASEELEALRDANIPVEIVPGITTAFAAAAQLLTPLTDRAAASRLILATGHHKAGHQTPIWTGSLPAEATLALYMPGRHFRALADDLIATGVDPDTPVAAISRATTPHQQTHVSTLASLLDEHVGPAPVLLLVGHAIKIQS